MIVMKTIIRIWTVGQQLGSKALRRRRPRRSASIKATFKARTRTVTRRLRKERSRPRWQQAAVVRKMPEQKRFAIVPHPRLRPAVGGEVAVLDWDVHQSAKDVGRCYSFLTPAPAVGGDVADDDDERWFVAAQNFDAQTRKHDIISDIMDNKEATTPSAQGDRVSGWCLVDELPDPDWPSRTGTSCPGSPGSP